MKHLLLALIAAICAAVVFCNLDLLWPLGHQELLREGQELEELVAGKLKRQGISLDGYQRASRLRVDDQALSYLESELSQEQCRAFINRGLPVFYYRLSYKKTGEAVTVTCAVHPNGSLLGWEEDWPRDYPVNTQTLSKQTALGMAGSCIALNFDISQPRLIEERSRRYEQRDEWLFVFECTHQREPLVKEEITITIAGDQVRKAWREISVPAAADRALHQAAAPANLLATISFAVFGVATIYAMIQVLLLLNQKVQLRIVPCLWLMGALSLMLLINNLLQHAMLFEAWDQLWPVWIDYPRMLLYQLLNHLAPLVPLFAFMLIAQHIDDQNKEGRMHSLWLCFRGRFSEPSVRHASWRGFAIGFIAGAVLVGSVLLCHHLFNGYSALQPRGFFYYTINSSASILTCLCFFGYIALFEEGAYRLFGGSWLNKRFGHRWLAILLPAVIYGLAHAEFAFLPPAEPWWARAACLTAVGCVWGWAFFRYDALTVILSHFAADLFIFNWPLIGSGKPWPMAMAIVSITIPLWPFIIGTTASKIKNKKPPQADASTDA